jgi:hypothetical protein
VLVAGGWILLARQPADWMNTSNWSRDLGIFGAVADLGNILPAIAFGMGLVFGLSFDTAGPQREVVADDVRRDTTVPVTPARTDDGRDTRAADEPLTADRGPYADPPTVPVGELSEHEDRERVPTTTTRPAGERRVDN